MIIRYFNGETLAGGVGRALSPTYPKGARHNSYCTAQRTVSFIDCAQYPSIMLSCAALTKCSVPSAMRALSSLCDCTELRSGIEGYGGDRRH